MDQDYKRLTDFLVQLGIEKVGHTSKTYLAHLIGVYRLMNFLRGAKHCLTQSSGKA